MASYMHVQSCIREIMFVIHACTISAVIINRLALEKFEVCWVSDKEVYWIKKDVSSQLWNKVGLHTCTYMYMYMCVRVCVCTHMVYIRMYMYYECNTVHTCTVRVKKTCLNLLYSTE